MTINPEVNDINNGYEYGWSNPERYAVKAPQGSEPRSGRDDLQGQGRAAVDARLPPAGTRHLLQQADSRPGEPT